MQKLNIALVDPHRIFTESLKCLLTFETQFSVVAQGLDGQDALDICRLHHPDFLIIELHLAHYDAKSVLRRLKDFGLQTKVIILTANEKFGEIDECIRLGAMGYLFKTADFETLLVALKSATSGRVYIDPIKEADWHNWHATHKHIGASSLTGTAVHITAREYDVLNLIAQGASNVDIAKGLFISEKTVKNHVSNLLKKLGMKDRLQLALFVLGQSGPL